MKRSVGLALIIGTILLMVGVLAVAQIYTVYDPIKKKNVGIERVSIEDITAWLASPEFSRWTNMEGLEAYLAGKGISLEDLKKKSAGMDIRERLSSTGRGRILRTLQPSATGPSEEGAIRDVECDLDDAELSFELHNIGQYNWFLVDQTLTTGSSLDRKMLSDALIAAKPIKLFVNNFPANSLLDKFWMGEKLFFGYGETFADACKADFVRTGKSVKCKLDPIPVRGGVISNSYFLITPSYRERGTFVCE